jgi:prophage antirepressor-like protein
MEESKMLRKYERTNIFIIDKELWAWAQYRAKTLGYQSASEYIFDLIKLDKEKTLLKQKKG